MVTSVLALQVEIFHQQHAETKETVLAPDQCHRQQQAVQAHQFVLDSLKSTMAQTLRMNAQTPSLREIEERIAAELLRRQSAPSQGEDDEQDDDDNGGSDDDGDSQGGGGNGSPPHGVSQPRAKRLRAGSAPHRLSLGGSRGRGRRGGSAGGRSRTPRAAQTQASSPPSRGRGSRRASGSGGFTRRPSTRNLPSPETGQQIVAVADEDTASQAGSTAALFRVRSPGKAKQSSDERAAGYRTDVLAVAADVLAGIRG